MEIKGRFGSKTDIGLVRPSNEDKALSLIDAQKNVLLCVCDGMGGMQKGDVASRMAVDEFVKSFPDKKRSLTGGGDRRWLTATCKKANNAIYETSERNPKYKGMGTTVVAA